MVHTNEEDEELEDVVVADGTADVKEEARPLRPELAHSVLTVVSMDIMLHNVQRNASTSGSSGTAQSVNRHSTFAQNRGNRNGRGGIVEAAATDGPDSQV